MNFILLFFALVDLVLLVWTFSEGDLKAFRLWFLRFMLFGMSYDNLVQGLGNWFIDAAWYEAANKLFSGFCWLFTLAALGYGIYHEVFLLNGATGAQPWGFLVGNFAEVVFVVALLTLPLYRATRVADQVMAPTLLMGGTRDSLVSIEDIRKMAIKMRDVTLKEYDCDHFEPYYPPMFDTFAQEQADFQVEKLA